MRNENRTFLGWLGLSNAPNWRVARPLGPLLSVILALLFIGAVTAAFVALARAISGGEGATSLGTGALIVGLLGAPFLVWSTVIRHHTLRYQKEGHITDRISKAVEQLGAEKTVKKDGQEATVPNIEVRIGAILSLERIAQDSTAHDNGRDHVRVMEILCAYVRENAPAKEAEDFPFPQECHEGTLEAKRAARLAWFTNELTARPDVQLALSVIGRRTPQQVAIEAKHPSHDGTGYHLDLSRTNLRHADLEHLNFARAIFFRSQMQYAFCKGADFSYANFVYCQLTGASASNANFSNCNIEVADLSHATLTGANLCDCKLSHTHFVRTNLNGAKFRFRKNINNTEVNRAFFIDSDLKGALIGGDLLGVVFSLRILPDETIPRGIYAVGFQDCRIAGTRQIFGDIHHESAIPAVWLGKTFGDASVTLPEGIPRPDHWPDWELNKDTFHTEWRKWQSNPAYTPPPPPEQD